MKKGFSYTAVLVTGAVVGAMALKTFGDPSSLLPGAQRQSRQAVLTALNLVPPVTRGADNNPVATAAAKLDPAVVSIHTFGKPVPQARIASPFGNDPNSQMFRHFFGMPQMPQGGQVTRGAGSGVIISPDGYVLTNNHVVADTSKVQVNVNGKAYDAHVVGADSVTDLAVVKINTGGVRLTPAQLGNSDDLRVGDWAIAVGNPLDIGGGDQNTVTLGIVSAINRNNLSAEGHPLQSVIQTDAAINPGNSGGALADINGRVIGINEAIESPTGYYSGIGFAIPINSARKVATQLIEHGKIVRPYLGVQYAALKGLSPDDRQNLNIPLSSDQGAVVLQVFPNTPAAAAGLQTYDVIIEANRQKVADKDDLDKIIQKDKPGDKLSLLVSRSGQNRLVTVTLRERPNDFGDAPAEPQGQMPDDSQGQVIPWGR